MIDKVKYEIHKASGTLDKYKSDLVGALISKRYSINDQIGLLRQQLTKPEEYAAFDQYANECIATVNKWFAEMEDALELDTSSYCDITYETVG